MEDLSATLAAARAALMQGDKATARTHLATVLRGDPANAQAWLLMSGIVTTPDQQRECLRRVLALDPANAAARRGLAALDAAATPAAQPVAEAPPAPAPAPSGLKRLGAAASPPPAPPSDAYSPPAAAWQTPSQPFAGYSSAGSGWPQPGVPSGGMAPPAPAVPDLYAPQGVAGMYGYPSVTPKRSQRPLLMVTIGLFVFAFTLFSLRMVRNANKATPPPTPKISAQDRATGFINSILGHYSNPLFFNADTVSDLVRPTARQYLRPEGVEEFLRGMEEEMRTDPPDPSLVSRVREIKQAYVANPRYTVIDETPSAITLSVAGGDVWIVMHDGRSVSQPMRDNFQRVYLENIDGVWYIRKIIFR